jgi:hypothetical protein
VTKLYAESGKYYQEQKVLPFIYIYRDNIILEVQFTLLIIHKVIHLICDCFHFYFHPNQDCAPCCVYRVVLLTYELPH